MKGSKLGWRSNVSTESFTTILDSKDEGLTFTGKKTPTISEIVTCNFQTSDGKSHSCSVDFVGNTTLNASSNNYDIYPTTKYTCSGTKSCSIRVSESNGTKLIWSSDLGGKLQQTVVDSKNETLNFIQAPIIINEKITCTFSNKEKNTCSSYLLQGDRLIQGFSCTGTESCSVVVSGYKNDILLWKSTLGTSNRKTIIDGKDDLIQFSK